MNRKNKVIVSIVGISVVLLAILGITYAYYLTRIEGNTNTNSISVTTAKLELVYSDNSEEIIEGTGALTPKVSTEANDAIGTKTFTVTNNGNDSSYVVVIDNVSIKNVSDNTDTNFLSNDFRYTLSCVVKDKSGNLLEGESCNQVTNLDVFPIKGGILVNDNIQENKVHEYTLTMWYIDTGIDQSDDMGKKYQARVNIKDMTAVNPYETGVLETDTKSLAYNIIENAKSGKNGTELLNAPLTQPAKSISLESESVLSVTSDDYGTSYYFRGNVIDNYVNFARMCWRIVRIEGDGSVKLILEDRYEECNNSLFTGSWSDENTYVFGYVNNRIDFVNYESEVGLANSFKSFQTDNLTQLDLQQLKAEEWCYDDKVTLTRSYGYDSNGNGVDNEAEAYEWYTDEYYGAYTRLYINKKPSLNCSGTKLTSFKDGTNMYVGTLTADEASFAGAVFGALNSNFYLRSEPFFLLSLYSLDDVSGIGSVFELGERIYFGEAESDGVYSRPAVTLKSGSVITEGEGTLENPYIIDEK